MLWIFKRNCFWNKIKAIRKWIKIKNIYIRNVKNIDSFKYDIVYRPNTSLNNKDISTDYNPDIETELTIVSNPSTISDGILSSGSININYVRHHWARPNAILFYDYNEKSNDILNNYMKLDYTFKITACRSLHTDINDTPEYSNIELKYVSTEPLANAPFTWVNFKPVDNSIPSITFPEHHHDNFEFIKSSSRELIIYFGYLYIPITGTYNFALSGSFKDTDTFTFGFINTNNSSDLNLSNDINLGLADPSNIIILYDKTGVRPISLTQGSIKPYFITTSFIEDVALYWDLDQSLYGTPVTTTIPSSDTNVDTILSSTTPASTSSSIFTSTSKPLTINSNTYYPIPVDLFVMPYPDPNLSNLKNTLASYTDYVNNYNNYKNNIHNNIIRSILGKNIHSLISSTDTSTVPSSTSTNTKSSTVSTPSNTSIYISNKNNKHIVFLSPPSINTNVFV